MVEGSEYSEIELQKTRIKNVSFGLRQVGKGEDLVLLHGFPTHGYTWRKLLPELSKNFKCHIIDLPGLGDSDWTFKSNFSISSQATSLLLLLDKLGVQNFKLIAHDSGGTIARIVAINDPDRVTDLVLINTEIPNHRPPYIELYQKISAIPLVSFYLRYRLNQKRFVRSSMGFKYAYSNRDLLNEESNFGPYLEPLIRSNRRTKGAFRYLRGIDWKVIDDFERSHKNITANVLLIWGEDDKTFPIELAKGMKDQFKPGLEFKTIEKASLLPQEERSEEVLSAIFSFFGSLNSNIPV